MCLPFNAFHPICEYKLCKEDALGTIELRTFASEKFAVKTFERAFFEKIRTKSPNDSHGHLGSTASEPHLARTMTTSSGGSPLADHHFAQQTPNVRQPPRNTVSEVHRCNAQTR